MSRGAPEGWEPVFEGPCVQADVLQAVLEANGLRPIMRQFEAANLLPAVGFDLCRIYVVEAEADAAIQILRDADGG